MTRTIIVLAVLSACGFHSATPTDGPIDIQILLTDSSTVQDTEISDVTQVDSYLADAAVVMEDANSDAAIDAPIDSGEPATCVSKVLIRGTNVSVETKVSCPDIQSVNLMTNVYSANDFLEETFLQGGVGCGRLSTLRLVELRQVVRVDVTFEVRQTGQTGMCIQN